MDERHTYVTVVVPYAERAALALIEDLNNDATVIGTKAVSRAAGAREVIVPITTALQDVLRRALARLMSRKAPLLPMHLVKCLFDMTAVSKLPRGGTVVLGFPGAALRVFTASGAKRVFHAVDTHPAEHNARLLAHYSEHEVRAELYPKWLVRRISKELELADVVLVPSMLVERAMTAHGVTSKIVVNPYGVDFDLFSAGPTVKSPTQKPTVLFVGQVSRRKGVPSLIDASRGLELNVIIVGNEFDRSLRQHAPPNITFVAPKNHAELKALYWSADAFVLPTVEDACALVTMEASAAGLPIITTADNGATEVFENYPIEILTTGSDEQLRASLMAVDLLTNTQRVANQRMSRSEVPSWQEWAARTNEVIDSL